MLEAYEDYLESLLDANVDLAHPKKKLVRFGSDLPAPERMSNMAPTYVVHTEFFAATTGESLQQWNSVLELRQQVPATGPLETNIRAAKRRTLEIAEQIVSKLVHDAEFGATCELMNALDDNVQIDPLGLEDENAYGWRISLRFTTTRYEYNASDWNA